MAQDRTEQPTSRRLTKAREEGRLPRSRDLVQAAQLFTAVMLAVWLGDRFIGGLAAAVSDAIRRMGHQAHGSIGEGDLLDLAFVSGLTVLRLVGPLALAIVVVTVSISVAQGGWVIAPKALALKWTNLSPVQGVKRLSPSRAGLDLVKAIVGVVVVTWIAHGVMTTMLAEAPVLGRLQPTAAARRGWEHAASLIQQSAIALFVLAGLDYGLQRWRHRRSLRMTKQEVKDDMRLTEGSPEVKGRIRRLQRELARRRMLADVPKATVVVTNPNEYAVALRYERLTMAAPVVVAKGRGLLAQRIKAIAREFGVPTVENVPLAQALYRGVEVGETIPGELFEAVAELLAYLVRLKRLVL